MSEYVLDASAVLAFLNREPGSERVAETLVDSVISAVNLSEVITKLIEIGIPEEEIQQVLQYLSCEIIPFDEDAAWYVARLRPLTRHLGLSLGDRACLGLALQLNRTAVTADRAWVSLNIGIAIAVIR
ncbi:MAG: type II toxin-antitoxin system VapC family toxin [Hydrococcus sp. RU_2_2]|nr:type II toxin-antitoxin system VapC family toxin [Hydrococcus sp. RU_2_2]NJP18696.1 type II toxin-antitoxin system VapC family toxin [Hydrococcus sp. CRU_1_1]